MVTLTSRPTNWKLAKGNLTGQLLCKKSRTSSDTVEKSIAHRAADRGIAHHPALSHARRTLAGHPGQANIIQLFNLLDEYFRPAPGIGMEPA